MASYGLESRFKDPRDCFRLNDPSAYNHSRSYGTSFCSTSKSSKNKYGFLSSAPRRTQSYREPYTDKIYNARVDHKIPNAVSLKATTPRFSLKPFTEEELDEILCTCDLPDPCVCPTVPVQCQAFVPKRVFKGPPPHSTIGDGVSVPTKRDRGFEILPDGSSRRLLDIVKEDCPPFYDARVLCSCEFYRGCKWSLRRTARTGPKQLEVRPGPADYTIEQEKTQFELCMEKVRAEKRKCSKQLRYTELIQEKNIREGRPGPADYYPRMPKCTDLKVLGSREVRFPISKLKKRPSPDTYSLKRHFDPPEPPLKPCNAKLPAPAGFGTKAARFITKDNHGPGPAEYDARVKLCDIVHCSDAPFGCSAKRFQAEKVEIDSEFDEDSEKCEVEMEVNSCPQLTWPFRSKTKRFKNTNDIFDPIIPNLRNSTKETPIYIQEIAPFHSSQGRFQPWFDWLPLHLGEGPGPCEYNTNRAKCPPAVNHGPLYRTRRFRENTFISPAPNAYCVRGGVEEVLKTYNKNLQANVNRGDKWEWIPPPEPRSYSYEERELMILEKAIKQLEIHEKIDVLKEESTFEGGSKRPSTQVEIKRRIDEEKDKLKAGIAYIAEKNAAPSSIDKHVTLEDKQHSAEDDWQPAIEHDERLSSLDRDIVADTNFINILPQIEAKSSQPKKHDDKKAIIKPKMLRTFLYKHEMPSYF
ncbi:hypothetical protein O0L34_g2689 [Tuta absoluta]|nr:hypothetical protein O0L34_g2689 [Tuta absoluta]